MMSRDKSEEWPLTIVRSRYNGVYEGGDWIAFACDHLDIPEAVQGGDLECQEFFESPRYGANRTVIGVGPTPNHAFDDLISKL